MTGDLTNHVWQSTLFAAAAGLLTVAFRKNRANVRYWLWFSASVKFFVPFSLLMSAGSHLQWAPTAHKIAAQIGMPAVSLTMERITQPFADTTPVRSTRGNPDWISTAALGVWVCGFAGVALMRFRAWRRVRAAVRASAPLEIPAIVEVRSSPGLLEPGVVGWRRPILLLPAGIAQRLSPPQLEAVLAHELCHVRRRDNLLAGIHMLAETAYWFHPFVWWIGAKLVEERERACDEEVLRMGSEPRAYAEAILNVCKLYVESPLVCVSGVTGSNLNKRIEAIMTNRIGQVLNRSKKFLLACAGAAALAGPAMIGVVIGIGHAPVVRAQAAVAIPLSAETPQTFRPAPVAVAAQAPAAPASPVQRQDRRMVALLFDPGSMTADELSRAQQRAIDFVHTRLAVADLVAVMVADNGKAAIVQDFTDNQAVLESVIQKIGGAGSSPGVDPRLSSIESVANLLAVFPGKKMLMYFSSGIAQAGMEGRAEWSNLIDTAKKSSLAIYLIDSRINSPQAVATFEGKAAVAASLLEGVNRESQRRDEPVTMAPIAGLPSRHASFRIYSANQYRTLSVPLDSLSGRIDITGEILMRSNTGAVGPALANVRDQVQATAGTWEANFTLAAGSYTCHLIVKEQVTGRMFGEVIDFEVN